MLIDWETTAPSDSLTHLILHTKWDSKLHVMNSMAELHCQGCETSWTLLGWSGETERPLEAERSSSNTTSPPQGIWEASSQGTLLPRLLCPAWRQSQGRSWQSTASRRVWTPTVSLDLFTWLENEGTGLKTAEEGLGESLCLPLIPSKSNKETKEHEQRLQWN